MLISGYIRNSCKEWKRGWSIFESYGLQGAGIYILNIPQ
jgi:hypothetical protein